MNDKIEAILKPLKEERKKWELEDKLDFFEKHLEIDTADYLEYLAGKALATGTVGFYADDCEDKLEKLLGEDYRSDNTYNYDEPYSRPMVVRAKKDVEDGAFTIALAPHYGGDVRGNYGDFITFVFDSYYSFVEACDEYFLNKIYRFDIDGKGYDVYYSGSGERFVLMSDEDGVISDAFYIGETSEEEIVEAIKREL